MLKRVLFYTKPSSYNDISHFCGQVVSFCKKKILSIEWNLIGLGGPDHGMGLMEGHSLFIYIDIYQMVHLLTNSTFALQTF